MNEEIEYPSKERERAKVNVKVSAEVNTYLHDLYNQIQYEFCEQYEDEIKDLQQKVEQLENENFNIRENIHLERISLPPELTKDKNFMELYDIPSYEDLQQKVEQLENIRKEVIEYIKDNACYSEGHCKCSFSQIALDNLLNILNKGENNE